MLTSPETSDTQRPGLPATWEHLPLSDAQPRFYAAGWVAILRYISHLVGLGGARAEDAEVQASNSCT